MHQEGSKSRFKEEQPFREEKGEKGGGFAFLPLPLSCFSRHTAGYLKHLTDKVKKKCNT